MHFALEEMGRVPTYEAFAHYCGADPAGRKALGDPARDITAVAFRGGFSRVTARQAVRWRIGLAYYAFLREIYVIMVLRSAGLDVRAHSLADGLFRADAWAGRTVLSLYVRDARSGTEAAAGNTGSMTSWRRHSHLSCSPICDWALSTRSAAFTFRRRIRSGAGRCEWARDGKGFVHY